LQCTGENGVQLLNGQAFRERGLKLRQKCFIRPWPFSHFARKTYKDTNALAYFGLGLLTSFVADWFSINNQLNQKSDGRRKRKTF
jgi:hypothetical protein